MKYSVPILAFVECSSFEDAKRAAKTLSSLLRQPTVKMIASGSGVKLVDVAIGEPTAEKS